MTGGTHRAGGMLVSILGFAYLREHGLLLPDMNEGLQWLVMYPFTMWGSVASDLDHIWKNCPVKDYPSRLINLLLHPTHAIKVKYSKNRRSVVYKAANLLDASHRSWQTHSDLTLVLILWLLYTVLTGGVGLGVLNRSVITLVLTGILFGVVAHFALDIITPDGIWLIGMVLLNRLFHLNLPEKIHLVPENKFFATGGEWEAWIRKLLKIGTYAALIWLLYTYVGGTFSFK